MLARDNVQLCRQRRLVIKHQPVFTAAGQIMEPYAQIHQHSFMARNLSGFVGGDDVLCGERLPIIAQLCGLRKPQHHLQIAQTAGTFLDVRFKIKRDVVMTCMPFALFRNLGVEELLQMARLMQLE